MRRVVGGVDDVLTDVDQRAPHREIVEDAREVANIRQRRRRLYQTSEIGVTADLDQTGIGLHHRVKRQRREYHAAAFRRGRHRHIEPLMQRVVKVVRLQDGTDTFDLLVVDKKRAEQSLLDFDVVRDVAVSFLFHLNFLSVAAERGGGSINRDDLTAASGVCCYQQAIKPRAIYLCAALSLDMCYAPDVDPQPVLRSASSSSDSFRARRRSATKSL